MRTLRLGLRGDDVAAWKAYLLGRGSGDGLVVDEVFDAVAVDATKAFQLDVGLTGRDVDGVVGPKTLARALLNGFDPLDDDSIDIDGPNWPPRPALGPLNAGQRIDLFGEFEYQPAPVHKNKEAIRITCDWAEKNIRRVKIEQLAKITGRDGTVSAHVAIADQLVRTFNGWQRLGLVDRVLSWGGCWVPRYVRGSRTVLSNHAWGTAFDINVRWNGLGSRPALVGEHGCVRELVESAYENGFYWGGWFAGARIDGMHFEAWTVV